MNTGIRTVAGLNGRLRLWCPKSSKKKKKERKKNNKKKERKISFKNNSSGFLKNKNVNKFTVFFNLNVCLLITYIFVLE